MAVVMGVRAYTHQTHAYVLKACTEPHTCLFPILANQAVLSSSEPGELCCLCLADLSHRRPGLDGGKGTVSQGLFTDRDIASEAASPSLVTLRTGLASSLLV